MLVTRSSARLLAPMLASAVAGGTAEVVLDFVGVEGITPSFLDELLAVLHESVWGGAQHVRVVVRNPPTRLSSKFEAVARAHDLVATSSDRGGWVLERPSSLSD